MSDNVYTINSENLVCAICIEEWIDRDPRILPCQHTFCFDCLKLQPGNSFFLKCPICLREVYMENAKIDDLPKNLLNSCLIPQDKGKNSSNEILCKNHKKTGILYCLDHDLVILCSKCFDEDHSSCKLRSVEKQKEYNKKIDEWLEKDKIEEEKLNRTLNEKKDEIFKKVEDEIEKVKKEVTKKFREREITVKNFNQNEHFLKDNAMNYESVYKDGLNLNGLDEIIQTEFRSQVKVNGETEIQNIERGIKKNPSLLFQLNDICLNIIPDKYHSDVAFNFKNVEPNVFVSNWDENSWSLINSLTIKKFTKNAVETLSKTAHSLQHLNLQCGCLSADNLQDLSCFISDCFQLKEINLGGQEIIGRTNHSIFLNLINSSKLLESLHLDNCQLNEENVKQLSVLFSICSKLKSINLGGNKTIGSTQNPIFQNLKKSSATLQNLSLNNCSLKEENIGNISELLLDCSGIKTIDLRWNKNIGCTEHPIFMCIGKSSNSLQSLKFSWCSLNEENFTNFNFLLSKCSTLRSICLCGNELYCSSIFKHLGKSFTTLETVELEGCNINEEMIGDLSELFFNCSSLKNINLGFNEKIGSTTHPLISNLKKSSESLEIINLRSKVNDSGLSEENIGNLSELFSLCTKLKKIHLSGNFLLGSSNHPIFLNLCKSSAELKYVNLSNCNLYECDKNKFAKVLPNCSDLIL